MPTSFSIWPDYSWLWRAMRQHGWVGLSSKRQRRSVPYASQLLAQAAHNGVNFGRIKGRRR